MKKHPILFSFRDYEEYKMVRELVKKFLQNILKEEYGLMEIAVNEAVNNALEYGRRQKCSLRMDVIKGRKLVVRVGHSGLGFNANSILANCPPGRDLFEDTSWDEGGRGILIMTAAADYVRYNRQGTEVIMVKQVSA